MELILNLAWALSAVAILCIWLRYARLAGASRRTQMVALAVLILILFPVISVTDDLQAMQNPAETDSCLRRVHAVSSPHSIFPAVGALPPPALTELSFGVPYVAASGSLPAPAMNHPALAPIQNRPPPLA
jgi:hypothetical protein